MGEPLLNAEFDAYAADYGAILDRGLAVTGERKEYFARGRIEWLARILERDGAPAPSVMDFGCGTGIACPMLLEILRADSVVGFDISSGQLEVARRSNDSPRIRFMNNRECRPRAEFDVAYCNGVLHHIRPEDRPEALQFIFRALRPGGILALWENNPWNPATRYVMSRVAFDRDAVPLAPPQAGRALREAGFRVLRTDFLFFLPRALARLRRIEPGLSRLPLGAQYMVLGRKDPLSR